MLKQVVIFSCTLLLSVISMGSDDFSWDQREWSKRYNTASDADFLSALEKNIITHLNRARSEPKAYAKNYIQPRENFYQGKYYKELGTADNFLGIKTQEGSKLVPETVSALNKMKPMALLNPDASLYKAAQRHAQDQGKTGETGHSGSDGSTPRSRIEAEGQWIITMGENISYGGQLGRNVVVQLLMDDGVPSRGHRKNIFNPKFTLVGVACENHPVFRMVCVMDLAGGMK